MKLKRFIPLFIKTKLFKLHKKYTERFFPEKIIREVYFNYFGKPIDLKNPKNLNEKINWLKLHSDLDFWAWLADKYRVREYVKSKGLEHLLPKLYGVYKSAYDIDFDSLPDSFVIKVNHGSGDCTIVKDKRSINQAELRTRFQKLLESRFDAGFYEPHYYRIKPRIIIEELLDPENQLSGEPSLVDYKVWCFNGKPYSIVTMQNRTKNSIDMTVYDFDWKPVSYAVREDDHHNKATKLLPRPLKLADLHDAAAKLSEGLPEARVDFYYINDKIYFGEITLTSAGGFMTGYSDKYLYEMGSMIDLKNSK